MQRRSARHILLVDMVCFSNLHSAVLFCGEITENFCQGEHKVHAARKVTRYNPRSRKLLEALPVHVSSTDHAGNFCFQQGRGNVSKGPAWDKHNRYGKIL